MLLKISSLLIIVSTGYIGGQISEKIGQDSMLGMLITGIILKNTTNIQNIPHAWTSVLWTMALAAVISRAGLSLQKSKVLSHLNEALLLGIIPVVSEAVVIAFMARLLFQIPAPWAFTLSFGVACISPGVVVPLILKLVDNGWHKSRLPSLLLTALGVDVLVGTCGFGIALASCFGHSHEHANPNANQHSITPNASFHESWIARGIEEITIGISLGLACASLAYIYKKLKLPESFSSALVYLTSTSVMLWCKTHGFAGAASCSTFITWGTLANTWDKSDLESVDLK